MLQGEWPIRAQLQDMHHCPTWLLGPLSLAGSPVKAIYHSWLLARVGRAGGQAGGSLHRSWEAMEGWKKL